MNAHFEPISGVIRLFEDGKGYGDKYTWAGTVRFIDAKTVEVLGCTSAPKPSEWRAIVQCVKDVGVKEIIFYRIRSDGTTDKHVVPTQKP